MSSNRSKKVSFGDRPYSPESSCSSTLTGLESPSHLYSDSEDSCVETYRIKSVLRGEMKGPVYVYGSSVETNSDVKTEESFLTDQDSNKTDLSDEQYKRKSTNILNSPQLNEGSFSSEKKRLKLSCESSCQSISGSFNLNQSKGLHEMSLPGCSNINMAKESDLNETLPYNNTYTSTNTKKEKDNKNDPSQFILPDIKEEINIKIEPGTEKETFQTVSLGNDSDSKSFIMGTAKDVHWNVNREYCIEENMEQMKYFEDHQNIALVKKEMDYDEGNIIFLLLAMCVTVCVWLEGNKV